jgi:dethiobiotin synthetase
MRAFQERGYVTVGMKPVASGCKMTAEGLHHSDAIGLQRESSIRLPYAWVNPYALAEPVAPHIAAEDMGMSLALAPLLAAFYRLGTWSDYVIVEGVGGWKVPLNATETTADLAKALGLPVVLVVGIRLGCLSHALLTCESIECHGLRLAGWVANRIDPDCAKAQANIASLCTRLGAPLLGVIPYQPTIDVDAISQRLEISPLLAN